MGKIDEIKEDIGYSKALLLAFMTLMFSLISWLTLNYQNTSIAIQIAAFVTIIISGAMALYLHVKIKKHIKELGDL